MSKYEIGQQIPVGGIITITGIVYNKNGNPVYNTDRGVDVPELLLERLEMKPLEKVQPEPKQEPVKLYCVEDCSGFTTKGKIYEFTGGDIRLDVGYYVAGLFTDYADFVSHNGDVALCLVPLVSRPAQVGEWVYIKNKIGADCTYDNGDIGEVEKLTMHPGAIRAFGGQYIDWKEYLVLDGYKPEPEKAEPEYYSGKVVCVDSAGYCHTIGKTYAVLDGFLIDDSGTKVPYLTGPVTSVDDLNSRSACKFAVLLDE